MSRHLSTAEVARILGLSEARVRSLVRSGLCRPTRSGRGYAYSFQDMVVLYAARRLLQQEVPAARVRRALAALIAELPQGRSLSGLRLFADGRRVAVREGDTSWNPETGQTLLDFEVAEVERLVHELDTGRPREAAAAPGAAGAARAFQEGLALEDQDGVAAAAAYRRALTLDPSWVDAWVNLGRLVHESGDAEEATRLCRRALELAPEDPVIHFNLALALEDSKGPEAAIEHYDRALALDPDFADAHYNLASLYEGLGRGVDALRHYHAYKKLTEA